MTYNDLDIPSNVKVALDSIVDWATTGDYTKAGRGSALTYVGALPQAAMEGQQMEGDPFKGIRMQIPYILGNIHSWKGQEARASKEVLKAYYDLLDKSGH